MRSTSATDRRLIAAVLLVVALGALGLAALGAAADRGTVATVEEGQEREPRPLEQEEEYTEPDWSVYEVPPRTPDSNEAGNLTTVALVIAAVVLAVLVTWLIIRMRRLARPGPATAAALAEEDELTATQARAALDDARTRLSGTIDAHDAVVAAWLALERAIAEAGIRRRPSQTTLEFDLEVLGTLDLDEAALEGLAHLYRRALFDDDPLGEEDRAAALTLLDRLTAQLDERAGTGAEGELP